MALVFCGPGILKKFEGKHNKRRFCRKKSGTYLISSIGEDQNAQRDRESDHGVSGRHPILQGPL